LQAKLEAKLGEEGEHEYRAALGKLGGHAAYAKLVAELGVDGVEASCQARQAGW
jgi:hypothetical protein